MLYNNILAFTLFFDLLSFLGNFGRNVIFSYDFNGFCMLFYSFLNRSLFRNFCLGSGLLCYCLGSRSGFISRLGDYDCVAILSLLGLLVANVIGGENCELGSGLFDCLRCRSFLYCRSCLFGSSFISCLYIRLGSFNGYVISSFLKVGFRNVNLAGLGDDMSSLCLGGRLCYRFSYGCYSFNYRLCYGSDLSYFLGNCVSALCLLGFENSALNNLDFFGLNNLTCYGDILSDDEV